MLLFRKSARLLVFILLLMFIFSSMAFAENPGYLPIYIYYENETGDTVKADYEQAVEDATNWPFDTILYDAIADAVRDALAYNRNIWVKVRQVDNPDITKYIHYSEAFGDGLTLWEAIVDSGYDVVDEPDYGYVLEIKDGVAVEMPTEMQAWLTDIQITYEVLIDEWVATLTFDFSVDPFIDYGINNWDDFNLEAEDNNIHIRGSFIADDGSTRSIWDDEIIQATPITVDGEYKLNVFIEDKGYFHMGKKAIDVEITHKDIKVTILGTTYTWYGEEL